MEAGTGVKTPREDIDSPGIEHNHTFESVDSHDEVEPAKPCHEVYDAEEPSSSLSPAAREKPISSSFLEVYQAVDSSIIREPTWYDHVAHVSYISVFGKSVQHPCAVAFRSYADPNTSSVRAFPGVFGTVFRIYVSIHRHPGINEHRCVPPSPTNALFPSACSYAGGSLLWTGLWGWRAFERRLFIWTQQSDLRHHEWEDQSNRRRLVHGSPSQYDW